MGNKEEQFAILDKMKTEITETWCSDQADSFNECFLFVNDFSSWVTCLDNLSQSILFHSSLNECATANLFCSQGLYKHAMISLRLCLEHCLYGIYMSSNDFYFRRWKIGQADMKWATITDSNTGIFSKSYIRAYSPEFEERSIELNGIACNVYRECSEYIHGNYERLNCLPGYNEFNRDMLLQYISRFQSISYLLSVSLVIRFRELIIQRGLLPALENAIMNNIGMLPEIQFLYDKKEDNSYE